jgi:hypothetical protein
MSANENESDHARTLRLRAEIAQVLEKLEDAQRRISKRSITPEVIAARASSSASIPPPVAPTVPPPNRTRAK